MAAPSNVGIDLHKTTLTIGVRDSEGKLVNTVGIDTKGVNRIRSLISQLPRPIHCAIESVGMYEWLWKMHKTRAPFRRGGSTGHNKQANIARLRATLA